MSTLGQLAAGVAHEINNPVNFIAGNLHHIRTYSQQLLQMLSVYEKHCPKGIAEVEEAIAHFDIDFSSQDLPKLLDSMEHGAKRIGGIVKTLQNFAGLDESGIKFIDINQSLDNVVAMAQHRLVPHAHRAEVQLTKTYANLPQIKGVPATLNQVFMNILANALDALDGLMAKPSHHLADERFIPCIHIATSHQESTVVITITNNGPTIPEHITGKLFEPFFTTKPVGQGTGMGLAISQKIVAFHKGTLQYVPNGKGETVFQVTLPTINSNV
ncbi:MAG: HAMP domain-containing histidine kinase [Merismopedia sp. SIO2A8]|nr:HAMP domain-containing histidine kinase [Merismopedia sp. SIO2A8]